MSNVATVEIGSGVLMVTTRSIQSVRMQLVLLTVMIVVFLYLFVMVVSVLVMMIMMIAVKIIVILLILFLITVVLTLLRIVYANAIIIALHSATLLLSEFDSFAYH